MILAPFVGLLLHMPLALPCTIFKVISSGDGASGDVNAEKLPGGYRSLDLKFENRNAKQAALIGDLVDVQVACVSN